MSGELTPSQFRYTTTANKDLVIGDPTLINASDYNGLYLIFQTGTTPGPSHNPYLGLVKSGSTWSLKYYDGTTSNDLIYANGTNTWSGSNSFTSLTSSSTILNNTTTINGSLTLTGDVLVTGTINFAEPVSFSSGVVFSGDITAGTITATSSFVGSATGLTGLAPNLVAGNSVALGGYAVNAFALLSGATFTGAISSPSIQGTTISGNFTGSSFLSLTVPASSGSDGQVLAKNGTSWIWITPTTGGSGVSLSSPNTWTASQTFNGGIAINNITIPNPSGSANYLFFNGSTLSWSTVSGYLLASSLSASSGASLVGFDSNLSYSNGTVGSYIKGLASLTSPSFSGVPTAPTAGQNTNTTQLATTAFVINQASTSIPLTGSSSGSYGSSLFYARADHQHPFSSGNLIGYTIFTSSGTYTKSTHNPSYVIVEVMGGGGPNGEDSYQNGHGGAGGGYSMLKIISANLLTNETVTVGSLSQSSSFGSHCSASGGSGYLAPGAGSGGDINLSGQPGAAVMYTTASDRATVSPVPGMPGGPYGLSFGGGANGGAVIVWEYS